MKLTHKAGILFGAASLLAAVGDARADTVASFYEGKTITLLIGNIAGGGYDQYARTLGRHIGAHIPGKPNILPKNMGGAGGLTLARHMYTVAPKDGTVFASVQNGVPIMPLLGQADGFDPSKFNWIGNLNKETAVCIAWHTSPVKKFADLMHTQMIVGTTGKGADLSSFEQPLINLLGAKLKVIRGYEGGAQVDLAMEKGEIEGRCGISWSSMKLRNADWLSGHKIEILVQLGFERHPDIPNVPLVQEFAASEDDRKILNLLLAPQNIGRAYFAPQGLSGERLTALREAFNAMLKDEAFIADAKTQKMQLDPVSGEALQKMLEDIYATPPALIARAREAAQ